MLVVALLLITTLYNKVFDVLTFSVGWDYTYVLNTLLSNARSFISDRLSLHNLVADKLCSADSDIHWIYTDHVIHGQFYLNTFGLLPWCNLDFQSTLTE